jgi:uncharacterized repeat protein (TIGR01451 family)
VGTAIADTATVSGGFSPGGTVTFNLYDNNTGTGPALFTDTETLVGGSATSASFTTTSAGTVYWVATYNGDGNNNPVSSGVADEPVSVTLVTPTITTTPSPSTVTLGTTPVTLTDTADLENGFNPRGMITFTLVAPGGGTVDTEMVPVNGNGIYTTPTGFTVPTTGAVIGTYQWNATYSGDPNNNPASDVNNPTEQVTVSTMADLALAKQVSPTEQMVGFNVTFTLILHNNGPSIATDVIVNDPFPAGVMVVGPNMPSQGTFDPVSGVWSVGDLTAGATATLTVTARVEVLGPITNTAHAGGGQFDPDLSNNTSSATLTGMRPPSMDSKRFFLSGAATNSPSSTAAPSVSSSGSLASSPPQITSPSTVVNALASNTVPTGSVGSISPFASTSTNTTAGNDLAGSGLSQSGPAPSILTSRIAATSSFGVPSDNPTGELPPEQESMDDPDLSAALSDAVFESFSAPADAPAIAIPVDAWELLDLEQDVNQGIQVPSPGANAAEPWSPDRWHSSSSLTEEACGLVALLGGPAFLGRLAGRNRNPLVPLVGHQEKRVIKPRS